MDFESSKELRLELEKIDQNLHLDLLVAKDRVQIDPHFVFDTTILSWQENLYAGLQASYTKSEVEVDKIKQFQADIEKKE